MADSFVLRNGGDYVLRNGGDRILRNPIVVVVEEPETSISHVTLDAGEDLRKKRRLSSKRQVQVLTLGIEIPCVGTSFAKDTITLKVKGTTKVTDTIPIKIKSPIKISHTLSLKTSGTSFSKQKTLASTKAEMPNQARGMKMILKKMRLLDTLKEALHSLDEDNK